MSVLAEKVYEALAREFEPAPREFGFALSLPVDRVDRDRVRAVVREALMEAFEVDKLADELTDRLLRGRVVGS